MPAALAIFAVVTEAPYSTTRGRAAATIIARRWSASMAGARRREGVEEVPVMPSTVRSEYSLRQLGSRATQEVQHVAGASEKVARPGRTRPRRTAHGAARTVSRHRVSGAPVADVRQCSRLGRMRLTARAAETMVKAARPTHTACMPSHGAVAAAPPNPAAMPPTGLLYTVTTSFPCARPPPRTPWLEPTAGTRRRPSRRGEARRWPSGQALGAVR